MGARPAAAPPRPERVGAEDQPRARAARSRAAPAATASSRSRVRGLTAPETLVDPDGNRVRLVPPGHEGVSAIGVSLAVRDEAAFHDFYGRALELEPAGARAYRCGDSLLRFARDPSAVAAGRMTASGYRYITIQVFDVDAEHAGILARGGTRRRAAAHARLGRAHLVRARPRRQLDRDLAARVADRAVARGGEVVKVFATIVVAFLLAAPAAAQVQTKESQAAMTPVAALERLKEGNARFAANTTEGARLVREGDRDRRRASTRSRRCSPAWTRARRSRSSSTRGSATCSACASRATS